MARRVTTIKVCDICETDEDVATRRYEWFGVRYEIDLCATHDATFKDSLRFWVGNSRKITRSLGPTQTTRLREARRVVEEPKVTPKEVVGPEAQWRFSQHALEQAAERGIDVETARRVAAHPEQTTPSRKSPDVREHVGEGLVVVVNPELRTILTVVHSEPEAVAL